jgi:hypothetical protein
MPAPNDRTPSRPSHPDLDWAIATNFAYLRPGDWLPLLVEFNPRTALGETPAARWRWFVNEWARTFGGSLLISEVFASLPSDRIEAAPLDVCVLYVRRESAARLVDHPEWQRHVVRAELGPPVTALPLPVEWPRPKPGGKPSRVAMGVIDQGIGYAHPRFRDKNGTRVVAVWQQDSGVISAAAIDAAIANGLDEEAVYRKLGGLDFSVEGYKPLAMRRSHGTQVLDLLAGYSTEADQRARPILAVDMPESAVGDPAGSLLTPYAATGLLWIVLVADTLRAPGETLPVVVNLSYGPNEGPHDGSGALERAIDLITQMFASSATPVTVVVAAGNSRQARIHAHASVEPGRTQMLNWRLQPCSRTPSAMELWFDAGAVPEVTLSAPNGSTISVSLQKTTVQFPSAAAPEMRGDFSLLNGRVRVSLSTGATESDPAIAGGLPVVPSGIWGVTIRNAGSANFKMHAWIRRSDTLAGRRAKGRQSYFDEPSYTRHTAAGVPLVYDPTPPSVVQRAATLSGVATGQRTFVIGGYIDSTAQPARYSSQGPPFNPARNRSAPDWLERSDDSPVCRGVLAAGNRVSSVAAMSGSSSAAPQAARRIADLLAAGGAASPPSSDFWAASPHPLWPLPASQVTELTGKGLRGYGAKRWPARLRP